MDNENTQEQRIFDGAATSSNMVLALLMQAFSSTDYVLKICSRFNPEMEKALKEMYENCPFVEWEQDMNATIPFCKKDGGFCNFQCIKEAKDE